MRLSPGLAAGVLMITCAPAVARAQASDIEAVTKLLGGQAIRSVDSDICLPADGDEYAALGKNAVLMLTARSAVGSELPLRSVYILVKGVRVPLQRITRIDKVGRPDGHMEQVSFYLLPIQLTKIEGSLKVDFAGERKGFGIMSFTRDGGYYTKDAPSFVRLDEYDDPSEPESDALVALLQREYSSYFSPS